MIDHNGNKIPKGTFVVWPFSKSHMLKLHEKLILTGNFQTFNEVVKETSLEYKAWVKMQGEMA
jgi:hypothetical protein